MSLFKCKRDKNISTSVLEFINILKDFDEVEQKKPYRERDICPPSTDPQLVVDCLADVFLGEDWYVSMPICNGQVNTVILDNILYKYYTPYRKHRKSQKSIVKPKSSVKKDHPDPEPINVTLPSDKFEQTISILFKDLDKIKDRPVFINIM